MRRKRLRTWLALAVPAAAAALVVGALPAASSAQAATAPNGSGVAASAGCVHISNYYSGGLQIEGNGVNNPVYLTSPNGSCWNQVYPFTYPSGGKTYSGWEYQDLSGHCLWQDAGVIEVGGACKAGHQNEEFFGYHLYPGQGWKVAVVADGTGFFMGSAGCSVGSQVKMVQGGDTCDLWNFP